MLDFYCAFIYNSTAAHTYMTGLEACLGAAQHALLVDSRMCCRSPQRVIPVNSKKCSTTATAALVYTEGRDGNEAQRKNPYI